MNVPKVVNAKDPRNIERAVTILRQSGLVAFPTETVYGLGADAFNEKAVIRIFEAKKRPTFDPLIVHVASPEQAATLWQDVPAAAHKLINAFWPGPLTLVLPKSSLVPDVVTSGLPTVAVRMPKNDEALSLIRALGRPIAAPSANLFGYTSPTNAEHVWDQLSEQVDLVLDGGESVVGLESTVLKVEPSGCALLRPGAVTAEQLEKLVTLKKTMKNIDVIESPGQLESHYAPWTSMILLDKPLGDCAEGLRGLFEEFQEKKKGAPRAGLLSFCAAEGMGPFESIQVLSDKGDLTQAAANLFQAMRKLDKMHLDLIVAEPVPEKGIGIAIMDRLRKASKKGLQC